jgi:hypothetical protein
MPLYIPADEITKHLKIDVKNDMTDEQWDAYQKLKGQEIISEAHVLARRYGIGLWSTTLIKKYPRPFSLGLGYPVSALGHVRGFGEANHRYRRSDVEKAWNTIPEHIREDRKSIVRGY